MDSLTSLSLTRTESKPSMRRTLRVTMFRSKCCHSNFNTGVDSSVGRRLWDSSMAKG